MKEALSSPAAFVSRLPFSAIWLTIAACLAVAASASAFGFDWTKGTPESQGFSSSKLEALRSGLAARSTTALLVIRNDTIVCEWYAPGHGPDKQHGTASLAKAIVGGLSLAVAMSDGLIGLDDPAAKFIPPWRGDPRKSRIRLRHLGSHTSGIEDAEADGKPHEQLTGWKGDFWKRLPVPNDAFTIARDRAPLVFEPGAEMRYSNPGIAMMTYCVTAALKDSPHKDIRTLLRDRVMRPIGVRDAEWSVGYGKTYTVDGLPLVASWGGGSYTARAAARIGRLMLRGGDRDGRRILSAEAVHLTTSDAGTPGPCGMGWWSNNEGDCAKLPRDAFFGSGAGHQILLVVPSLNLIVVRNGAVLASVAPTPNAYRDAYRQFLFEPLMEAITGPGPQAATSRASEADAAPQLRISDDHRYLVDQDRRPFFLLADTPWFLQKLPIEDVRRVLDDRKAKGFNALFLEILDDSRMPSRDAQGQVAFQPEFDITRPVEGYWRYADTVMEEATRRGFFVIMSDLWYGAGKDGDGRKDIVMMGDERTQLKGLCWFKIPADPRRPWERHPIGPGIHGAIAPVGVADINGDGHADVVGGDTRFENKDGKGREWIARKNIPMGRKGPYGVCVRTVVADVDGDGKCEIVMCDADIVGSKAAVLRNVDGKGGAWEKIELPLSFQAGSFHSLAVADLNGDGRRDILVNEQEELLPNGRQNPRWIAWENLGGGKFAERVLLDTQLGGHELQVGDADGDGDIDICSKPWGVRSWNGAQGRMHVDYLENLRNR